MRKNGEVAHLKVFNSLQLFPTAVENDGPNDRQSCLLFKKRLKLQTLKYNNNNKKHKT